MVVLHWMLLLLGSTTCVAVGSTCLPVIPGLALGIVGCVPTMAALNKPWLVKAYVISCWLFLTIFMATWWAVQ